MSETTRKTTSKIPVSTAFAKPDNSNFYKLFIELRVILDSIEANALLHCLEPRDIKIRERRAKELIKLLKPIAQNLPNILKGGCDEGFHMCNGCCVPYPCPIGD